MADVAASANDPIFLNHHAMVDCIFEAWLQKNPNAQYPVSNDINNIIPKGHRYNDYIVPFFPLYTHGDMFSTAENFGYQCKLQSGKSGLPSWAIAISVVLPVVTVGLVVIGIIISIIVCVKIRICSCNCNKAQNSSPEVEDDNNLRKPFIQPS